MKQQPNRTAAADPYWQKLGTAFNNPTGFSHPAPTTTVTGVTTNKPKAIVDDFTL